MVVHDTRVARSSQCRRTRMCQQQSTFRPTGDRRAGTESIYRLDACLRQPHWQLIGAQRQAFAWHPHEQAAQSHVPQQPVLETFCEVDVLLAAMVKLLGDDNASLRRHRG
ncbi:MAG: hypothetical protein GDA66_05115 [Nitrospira sp. CR1.2]|nr:hypothetical protein [Nitrospira sp. CR1.2]